MRAERACTPTVPRRLAKATLKKGRQRGTKPLRLLQCGRRIGWYAKEGPHLRGSTARRVEAGAGARTGASGTASVGAMAFGVATGSTSA